ncbi:MAG: helix-turn-helix domain-containing protein [Bacteroidales bacterium]|nr:helix-turn-helix domain-containing protein [Bacteroidales bacterium]
MKSKFKDKTIAVLPFVNISSDKDFEYFSDGITEEIINALAQIGELKVISRTSSFYFKNKAFTLKQIADKLKVEVILEGSVRIASNKVRITAQLIQAADDFHFWSETWDRSLENILEVQDEISLLIAEKLREQLGHLEISEHLVQNKTNKLDAYEYVLKAKFHFNKWNPEDVNASIDLFNKAIEIDANFTEAYVGLADAYSFMATTQFMAPDIAWKKAVENTHKAYALDPQNAGVHYLLANLSFFTDCHFEDAFLHISKSVQLKPSYPEAQQYIAFLYMLSGDMQKAKHHLQFALSIDPLNQETIFYQAYFYYRSKAYDKAMPILDDLLLKNPKNIPAFVVQSYCMLFQKKYDELLARIENAPKEILIPHEKLGILCLTAIFKGDEKNALTLLNSVEKEAENPGAFQAHSYLFLAYANLHKNDKAFEVLENSLKMKSSVLLLSFSDPLVKGLVNDERYGVYHNKLYGKIKAEKSIAKKKPLLDNKTAVALADKILIYVDSEKPYLNPSISLRDLANQLEIHPNQLSWLLNEYLGKKFNEFINLYRLNHFKELAKNPENANISIIGLAYESGFNSKTVFNTSFKKEFGITPKEYQKKIS